MSVCLRARSYLMSVEHNKYVFGHGFYSATLEKEFVKPGMILQFTATPISSSDQDKVGILSDIEVGGTTELVLTTIDVGMLTHPRNEFDGIAWLL